MVTVTKLCGVTKIGNSHKVELCVTKIGNNFHYSCHHTTIGNSGESMVYFRIVNNCYYHSFYVLAVAIQQW